MRPLFFLLSLLIFLPSFSQAADKKWYVTVYGEHFQPITGASVSSSVKDGSFLDSQFIGKELYVRSEEHYELDEFRPKTATNSTGGSAVVQGGAVAMNSPEQPMLMTEFGPLVDTALQYQHSGDFHGWYCDRLYVKPMGQRVFRLRCDSPMKHE